MKTVVKPVYYCDFCKRHRIKAEAIQKHEPRCIYNPLRSECGWHKDMKPSAPADLVAVFKESADVEWLRRMADGCPACMYRAEIERYRKAERADVAW